jgi:hypothetical protein
MAMDRPSLAIVTLLLSVAMAIAQAVTRPSGAQTGSADPKARCAQLVAFWERHSAGKSEGSGGADMVRKAAVADCEAGRYDSGIRTMEDLLRRNGYTVPPT